MKDKNLLGAWGENYASKLYLKKGFQLLVRNTYNRTGKRLGEIDFIVRKSNLLIFVEVKTRTNQVFGLPEESISKHKQQRLLRSVYWFLYTHQEYQGYRLRIDVCAILLRDLPDEPRTVDLDKFVKYSKIITNAVELN